MTQFSGCRQNKLISKFVVTSEIAFVSYAHFNVLYCFIGHNVGNYYVDIINRQFYRLFRQTNEFARTILHTNIMHQKASADIETFLERTKKGVGIRT